jgi:SM-20-related protein
MQLREVLDNLSGGLLCDDRILTTRERELLADILRRAAQHIANSSSTTVLNDALAQAVGETLAQRAYTVLGQSIIELMIQPIEHGTNTRGTIWAGTPPTTPPGPSPDEPPGSHPPFPGCNQADSRRKNSTYSGVMPLPYVLLDEFLAPAELASLIEYTLARESEFRISEVVSPNGDKRGPDFEHRRSRVLSDLGPQRELVVQRLLGCLPQALEKLDVVTFPVTHIEAQITASNHGDFFRCHTDSGAGEIATRGITFVYFFHREPKQFAGGELRLYDSPPQSDRVPPTYHAIVPEQNQLVVFPSSQSHEITPVECLSGTFADSRFTVNGWLHR